MTKKVRSNLQVFLSRTIHTLTCMGVPGGSIDRHIFPLSSGLALEARFRHPRHRTDLHLQEVSMSLLEVSRGVQKPPNLEGPGIGLLKGKLMSPLLLCSFQLTPEASIPHFSGPSTRGPGQHFPNTTCLGLAPSTFRPCFGQLLSFLSLHVFQSHGSCLGSFHMIGMGDPRVSTWTREAENPRIHWPRTKQFFVPSE